MPVRAAARNCLRPCRSVLHISLMLGLLCVGLGRLAAGADEAQAILAKSGVTGGFIVHVGCGDGQLTGALRVSDAYVVHGLDTDAEAVEAARRNIAAIRHGGKLSAAIFDGKHLPYIDNMVNLIYCSTRYDVSDAEIMRVLTPRGMAIIVENGQQRTLTKSWPAEYDEWHHYLHDADNNAVSKDTAIKPPISHLQWRGSPMFSRHHDKSATHLPGLVTARGRIFYIMDHGPTASVLWPADVQLVARDAFNGVVLWRKRIEQWIDHLAYGVKQGPAVNPRRLVAIGDAVYVTLGVTAPVSKLDSRTGDVLKVYAGTEKTEEILVKDGILYLVVNPTVSPIAPPGMVLEHNPKQVLAVDEVDGRILWKNDVSWIAPCTLTVGTDHIHLCNGPSILSYDRETGKQLWQSQELPWRERMPTYFAPTLVAAPGGVLYAGGGGWREHAGSMGLMSFLDASTGDLKWQAPHLPSGYQSPQDIFVIDGRAWCGSLNSKPGEFDKRYPEVAPSTGEFIGYDLESGQVGRSLPGNNDSYWFHHRCHRAKATENFFLTSRTGIEMVDIQSGQWSLHHWVRGACLYGIMPANGLIYAPSNPCACYPEAKLSGFNALSGPREAHAHVERTKSPRLVRGTGYDSIQKPDARHLKPDPSDWPTYRGTPARSGATASPVTENLETDWTLELGGKLSPPVIAGGKVFVSAVDQHSVVAIDQTSGQKAWTHVAGGRVDSPPTCYQGLVLFGCTDGYVYCLRAEDGQLVWQFRAAPSDRRHMVYEQLESVWPVHGAVLVRDDVAYVTAGRSMFLEGGIVLYRLNPRTGEVLSEEKMNAEDPLTGESITSHIKVLSMPVASSDILSSEGDFVFMRSQPFDLQGKRTRIAQLAANDQKGPDSHLFAANGFLDDSWWHRAFWQYGRAVTGGHSYASTGHSAPAGKIMVLDEDHLYIYGRKANLWRWTVTTEYSLYSADRSLARPTLPADTSPGARRVRKPKRPSYARRWEIDVPILARAMVKAGDVLFAAGPRDIVDEFQVGASIRSDGDAESVAKQADLFAGSDGSVLCAVSARNGGKIAEANLDVLPVFDGMIAAAGRIYLSTVDGKVVCLGREAMDFQALEQTAPEPPVVIDSPSPTTRRPSALRPIVPRSFVAGPNDILVADFEGEDYGPWTVEGEAFGNRPAVANVTPRNKVNGHMGNGLVNSFLGGDKPTGKLTSSEFTIQRKHINFLIGGGSHAGRTCMNLVVDGEAVRTAVGPARKHEGHEVLKWMSWDIAEFAGKQASLQIVDDHSGGWGHVNIDHIVQSDRAPAATPTLETSQ